MVVCVKIQLSWDDSIGIGIGIGIEIGARQCKPTVRWLL